MEPNIVTSPQQPPIQPIQPAFKPWYKGPKLIFAILGILILGEVVWGASKLLTPVPKPKSLSPAPAAISQSKILSDAQISLLSDKQTFKAGDKITVNIQLATGGHEISGMDLVLNYDPNIIQADDSFFARGNIFPDYPKPSIDSKSGQVSISGVAGVNRKYFNGTGIFGTITFQAVNPGKTNMIIISAKGSTSDSNVFDASSNLDVLDRINNLTLVIQ